MGEEVGVLFLHAAFLLRLFLLSVRRLVHPASHSQRSLLKNSPLFLEIDSYQPFLEQTISISAEFSSLRYSRVVQHSSYLTDNPGMISLTIQFFLFLEICCGPTSRNRPTATVLLVRNPPNILGGSIDLV